MNRLEDEFMAIQIKYGTEALDRQRVLIVARSQLCLFSFTLYNFADITTEHKGSVLALLLEAAHFRPRYSVFTLLLKLKLSLSTFLAFCICL
jgi:cellulose synthase/poly-beta-1,6-N-acetylglucosamine synthase-like glycosyltransferase